MATKNDGKKIVEIKENPAKKEPEAPNTNEGQNTPEQTEVKYTFGYCLRHPFKAIKHAWDEHPVATGVVSTAAVGGLAFLVKVVADALSGGETEDDCEDLTCIDEVEDEDDEEEEI